MSFTIYFDQYIDMEEVLKNAKIHEKWELLQMIWNDLKEIGGEEDWMSFYKDNNIGER